MMVVLLGTDVCAIPRLMIVMWDLEVGEMSLSIGQLLVEVFCVLVLVLGVKEVVVVSYEMV